MTRSLSADVLPVDVLPETVLPATILTGFLGAGKTTLLRHLLYADHGEKIAVIENEFGAVAIDDALLGDRATRITTLSNGCICCSSANELSDALHDLLDGIDRDELAFDRLVIECTGMADPGPVIQTFFSDERLSQRFLLDGVIALVDAVHADEQLSLHTVAQAQVGYADRLLLTKTDLAGDTSALEARLTRINARASLHRVTNGQIDHRQIFGVDGFMLNDRLSVSLPRFRPLIEADNAITSLVVRLTRPVEMAAVSVVMEQLLLNCADNLLRYKGVLAIDGDDRRLLFQGVQRLYSADWDRAWRADESRESVMVFIGIRLPEDDIRHAFDALNA
ncbi:GTPase [Dickeya dianthicola]|uniref:GTPase n=1 Tax=Dickeya dianthicola TaxID=204039 RepID=UPI0003A3C141|nr:GTPase [Dickeya dianthicola]ATO34333.1 Putative metal chaperone, involved in Z homeostasis, GTPase of COG0523 family [Dickeya dianthicola RNS04.9]MBT1429227.1 GTPase [Dickeya dianthicola]MBT1429228.1 GTPase [Dickeya dianthicola]MBT1433254.1 GTPase [Dickeya dianthicola]MBT1433255.1 GTPase [Dickeya dianthicola]